MRSIPALIAAFVVASPLAAQEIPDRPEQLTFETLEFEPPSPADFRHELPGGIPVYLAKSDEFPLVTITLSFKGGSYLEPVGKTGLASMTGTLVRQGGTSDLSPSELDEEFAFLAANVSASVGNEYSSATINCLKSNLDEAFGLFMTMLREPGFDSERTEVVRGQVLEGLKQRDDQGIGIAFREMGFLLWGEDHFEGSQPTGETIGSITRGDMEALHARIFHPGNMMVSVVGDFDQREILEFLADAFADWEAGELSPDAPAPTHAFEPGLYHYEKDQPQSQVVIGQRTIERDHPDAIPMRVMNDILGGGGFTSRITNRVRTDEGLAYSAGSFMQPRVNYDGMFGAYFFSKNPTVALAAKVTFDEITKIRDQEVTTDELDTSKKSIIETFPRRFENKAGIVSTFINDERTGRHPNYWKNYRDRVESVTVEEVQRVARQHLDPEQMMMLVVGPWEEIAPGNTGSEDDPSRVTTMDDLYGEVKHLPKRDPVSLEPKP